MLQEMMLMFLETSKQIHALIVLWIFILSNTEAVFDVVS
jgi:hypothetical protein